MRLLAALIVLLSLTACAVPTPNDTQNTAPSARADADQADPATSAQKPMRTGGPVPPERVDERKPDPNVSAIAVDATCKTDADCTVKNVGNCCGYYPACVNVNSPTDPKGVQERCAKSGMMSVCGFQEISACSCKQGRCEAEPTGLVQ